MSKNNNNKQVNQSKAERRRAEERQREELKRKQAATKKRNIIIVSIVVILVIATAIGLGIYFGTRDRVPTGPACNAQNCNMHPGSGVCHCHGRCRNSGCRCHRTH